MSRRKRARSAPGPLFSRGSQLLDTWRGGRPAAEVCAELGINEAALYNFARGLYRPGPVRAERIEFATKGAVPAESWQRPPRGARRAA